MRPILCLCVFLASAGSALACGERLDHAALRGNQGPDMTIAGSVWLQPRPLQGSVPHMPDLTSPVVGPHGGQLAAAHTADKAG